MKKKTYQISVPIRETWIFRVEADNKKEALEKYHNHEGEQVCSDGGWPNAKGTIVIKEVTK